MNDLGRRRQQRGQAGDRTLKVLRLDVSLSSWCVPEYLDEEPHRCIIGIVSPVKAHHTRLGPRQHPSVAPSRSALGRRKMSYSIVSALELTSSTSASVRRRRRITAIDRKSVV